MERVERIWQNLWKRKKKKVSNQSVNLVESENKENLGGQSDSKDTIVVGEAKNENVEPGPQKVIVKTTVSGGSKTFPRSHDTQPSPAMPRWKRDPVAASSASLRGRRERQELYDRTKWVSNQHFHIPYGTQPRRATSRGALSVTSVDNVHRNGHISHRPHSPGSGFGLRAHSPVSEPYSTMRRPVEPYDRYKSSQNIQHFHVPSGRRSNVRLTYGRPGTRTAMSQLVDQMKASSTSRPHSPTMNNEEPIQLAHYPSGVPGTRGIEREDFPAPPFPFSDQDRKRRRSGSVGSNKEEDLEEEEKKEEVDPAVEEKLRRHEEELMKISNGIGKVFLDTIKKTERIRSARLTNIDPRSAARTPAANRMPKYRLRYDSPAWASPSRDTMHGRPWDSEEDLERPVVLTSSGCASGCTSDHMPNAAAVLGRDGFYSASHTPHARSTSTLVRSIPSLPRETATSTIRSSTPIKPGYTQGRSQTLPHIRSVSGRIISSELELGPEDEEDYNHTTTPNTHSGVVSTVNNSFSWATLARYQGETLKKDPVRNNFFKRPELKHKRTILDK